MTCNLTTGETIGLVVVMIMSCILGIMLGWVFVSRWLENNP